LRCDATVVFRFALRAGYTVIEYPCEEVFRWALFVLFGDWGDLGDPFVTHSSAGRHAV